MKYRARRDLALTVVNIMLTVTAAVEVLALVVIQIN